MRTITSRIARAIGLFELEVALLALTHVSAVLTVAVTRHDWAKMHWSRDGRVSLGEVLQGADVGRRALTQGRLACTEFFAFKDGLPIRTDCPRATRQEGR